MKLRFEPDLAYQREAIDAVCDLFEGQDQARTEFTVAAPLPPPALADAPRQSELFPGETLADAKAQMELYGGESGLGIGNRLALLPEAVLENVNRVQLRHALAPSPALNSMDFTVEMETGTGKTYVYLRTIFELNRRYGWTKFVVVVPSVAIREGVAKTWEMTREHFRGLFAGTPADLFVYDSSRPGDVRDFATSATIKIMVATIGALRKTDQVIFYQPREQLGGERPIDLVRATRPVVIIDEPQSVDAAEEGAGARTLQDMGPLCRLRYSATHVHKHHMVYRLDAVDAYQQKLVKRIDVAGVEIQGAHNSPYVRLISVKTRKGAPTAVVEVDVQLKDKVARVERKVADGADLEKDVTNRKVYEGVSIGTIEGGKGRELVQLNIPGDVVYLRPGESYGDVDRDGVVRRMIERTIREHFDREKVLKPLGIKVLTLFFIDRVSNYRDYREDGSVGLGPYGRMFEEEYRKLAKRPGYAESLFGGRQPEPETAHSGYFSQDKKGNFKEPELNAAGELRNNAARDDAERGFKLIMRDKERLLDEAEPLRFIFSHSALREGWDNPNVFQICVLRGMGVDRERRQTIGRGLRLCVDSTGERRRDEGLNVLTVIADESYNSFAKALQDEIARDIGVKFGIVEAETFAALSYADENGAAVALGVERSSALVAHLKAAGLIDAKGAIQDDLRRALRDGSLVLPSEFQPVQAGARALLVKLAGKLEVRNADERRVIPINKAVYLGDDFCALWDKVKARTTYRLAFDNEALIAATAKRLAEMPPVSRAQLRFRKAELAIDRSGVDGVRETVTAFQHVSVGVEVPDVLGELQNRTQLTRRSLARILTESGRLDDLRLNPAAFIDQAADLIGRAKIDALVDGVRYQRIGDGDYYAQELFESEELQGYLRSLVKVDKAPHEAIAYDSSTVERPFAEALNANEAVKVFAKLPGWFKIPTPLGNYNPDWAVLVETEAGDRLYFVVETKGSAQIEDLRGAEQAKVKCGRKHFEAIAAGPYAPAFEQTRNLDELLRQVAV